MNYNEALEYIHGSHKFGIKLGLDNIKKLLELLNDPQKKLKFIHVAGTNGKGSTSSFIANILMEEGYKVGLFTSPYLERFNERIRINNELIPDNVLADITYKVKLKVEKMVELGYNHPTEFEIVTAISFMYFLDQNVDYVVLEVGLGGRYDSTNIIEKPLVCVITPIDMDHMNILGDTLAKIAYEKAGIIKENSLVISHYQKEEAKKVIDEVVKSKDSEITYLEENYFKLKKSDEKGNVFDFNYKSYRFEDLKITLIGNHQMNNASLAILTILKLNEKGLINIRTESIINGLLKTKWNGRLEMIKSNPKFIIDGAHNLHGAKALVKALENINYDKLILGIGMLADKDVDKVLEVLIPKADKIIITEAKLPRALNSVSLAKKIDKFNKDYFIKNEINDAVNMAFKIANNNDLILFSGSLYIIGDVRKYVKNGN